MDPGSVGTSLHFDGHDLQSLQEAEYRKEEEEQQCELRQILTNAFDLMEEDILSETSEECESHDGSSYKPDTSFGREGDNQHRRDVQDQRFSDGYDNFEQLSNPKAAFHQTVQAMTNYPQKHELQREYHYSSTQNIPKSCEDAQRNGTEQQTSKQRPSHEFLQFHGMTLADSATRVGHEFTTSNQGMPRKTSMEPENTHTIDYSSLPADIQHQNTNNNHHTTEPTNNEDIHYRTNGHSPIQKYYPYSNTPEPLPQSDMAINAYYTENRYTVAGRRSSLDISYPNQESLEVDHRPAPTEFTRNNQDFYSNYPSDLQSYKPQNYGGSLQNLTETNHNFDPDLHIHKLQNYRSSQQNLAETNPNFNPGFTNDIHKHTVQNYRGSQQNLVESNTNFNPGFQSDIQNHNPQNYRGSQQNLIETNPNFDPGFQSDIHNHKPYNYGGSQQNLTESNPNFNPMSQQTEQYEDLSSNNNGIYQVHPSLANHVPSSHASNGYPVHSYQYSISQNDSGAPRYSEIPRQTHEIKNPSHLNSAPMYDDIPSRANRFSTEKDSLPKHKSEAPVAHQETYPHDDVAQLRILNKARVNELEDLSNKYEALKQESAREMRILKHQLTLMEEEKDRLKSENHQVEDSNRKLSEENHSLRSEMNRLVQELDVLKESKESLFKELKAAETNIENLNMQVIEAQLSDTQNRNRQQQEMMIAGLQQKFEQEQQAMAEKFEKAYQIINEKEEAIESLKTELQEERIKVSLLEKNEGLRGNGHDKTEEICRSLQMEIQGLKDQLQNSHNKSSSRLGAYSKSTQVLDNVQDDSLVDLGIRKTLHFNSTPNISRLDEHSTQERIEELQRELESIQSSNKRKQEMIDRLERDLTNASTHVDILRKTLASKDEREKEERELEKRLEEMVENEEKLTEINKDLEKKVTKLEDQQKDLVDRRELEKTLKELDKVKEMYITECEDRGKHEQKLREKFDERLKQTTDAFVNTEAELSSKIKELSEAVAAKEEAIKEMNLESLAKKYSKDKLDSSFIDNLHVGDGPDATESEQRVLNNKREQPADESKDSSSLNNSELFFKNNPESGDSFEKNSNESMRSSNQSWQSGIAVKAISDLKKQHKSEIEYVRRALIEENQKISISLHRKLVEMREGHKQVIRNIKEGYQAEKAAMLEEFDRKQQAYLKCTKPDVKLMVELGSQYLGAVENLKSVLMQHVHETNRRAAEKIKQGIGQERAVQMGKVYKSNNFDGTLQGFL